MKKVLLYLRLNEWMASKIVFMIGILLFFLYTNGKPVGNPILVIVAYFLYTSMFMASSYVANDFSDIEIDKKTGKQKVIAELPRWMIWASFAAMFLIGNVPVMLLAKHKLTCTAVIAVTYYLGLAYSGLGLRFKEKGIWGLLECSLAQRCMPLLMIPLLVELNVTGRWSLAGWMIVSFLDGLRYILIHQTIDLQNDLKTGVQTYVSEKRSNFRNSIAVFLALETGLLCVVMGSFWKKDLIGLILTAGIYFACEYCIYQVLNVYAKKDWLVTFDSVPLEAFLNFVFPFFVGLCLCRTHSIFYLVYCLIIVFICWEPMKIKLDLVKVYVQSKLKRG